MRRADVLIYGASGFTGKWIARRIAGHVRDGTITSYALGGRSAERLAELRSDLLSEGFPAPMCESIADTKDDVELEALASRTRLLINAVGPFRLHGESVVRACITAGCDYLDISGEPYFLELIAARFNSLAIEKGVLIIGAAAFDCVPAELGVNIASAELRKRGFLPTSVLGFLSLSSTGGHRIRGHFATYESAVLGLGGVDELKRLRAENNNNNNGMATTTTYGGSLVASPDGVSIRKSIFWSKETKQYALPFPGADASVVRRTASHAAQVKGQIPVAFNAFMTLPSFHSLALMLFYGTIFSVFSRFHFGRSLLLRFPAFFSAGIFSHTGPSRDEIAAARFKYKFIAIGHTAEETAIVLASPRRKGVTAAAAAVPAATTCKNLPPATVRGVVEISGPEPGYDATSTIVAAITVTILKHRSTLPSGVHTPGTIFTADSLATNDLLKTLALGDVRVSTLEEPHIIVRTTTTSDNDHSRTR